MTIHFLTPTFPTINLPDVLGNKSMGGPGLAFETWDPRLTCLRQVEGEMYIAEVDGGM
jgi:hypothetical protein